MPTQIIRNPRLRLRFVSVVGHYGKPSIGVVLTPKNPHTGTIDVAIARPLGLTPAERVTVRADLLRPCDRMHPDLPAVMAKLRDAGTISYNEERAVLKHRRELLKPTLCKRKGVSRNDYYDDKTDRAPLNIGRGKITADWRRMHGVW